MIGSYKIGLWKYIGMIILILSYLNDKIICNYDLKKESFTMIHFIYSEGFVAMNREGVMVPMDCGLPTKISTKQELLDLLTKVWKTIQNCSYYSCRIIAN